MRSIGRIAVLTVSWNHAAFLRTLVASLHSVSYPNWEFILVDNASRDDSSYVAKNELLDLERGVIRGTEVPARLVELPTNIGFAGGMNQGIALAKASGCEYVFLLNPDAEATPTVLTEAILMLESDSTIGAVQPLILLADDRNRVNSWGNEMHYLGFGFCGGHRELLAGKAAEAHLVPHDIPSASGAAMFLRISALANVGVFDEQIFAYHEDADLSWRLRLGGFRVVLAPRSVVLHHYEFSRSIKKFYFMERNRFLVHIKNLKIRTLLLLLPASILMEFGLWFFAIRSGWWREKLRAYGYFLNPKNVVRIMRSRRVVQSKRIIPDRDIVRYFSPTLRYQDMRNRLWDYVGNPIFATYWYLVRGIVRW